MSSSINHDDSSAEHDSLLPPQQQHQENEDQEFDLHPIEKIQKRSSGTISTIFSIVNTMVGSTILSLSWGFTQSGLYLGIIVFIVVGFISYYTCNLVVKHSLFKVRYDANDEQAVEGESQSINDSSTPSTPNYSSIGESKSQSIKIGKVIYTKKVKKQIKSIFDIKDFSQVCVEHLGKWSEILCILTSIVILVGASIAYHIFMKDCLVSIIDGIANIQYDESVIYPWEKNGPPWYWNGIFASLIIVAFLFPITLFKNLNFLVKFNSFGIFFVLFLLVFIIYASIEALVSPFEMSSNVASVSSLTLSAIGLFGNSATSTPSSSSKDSYNIADDVIRKGDEVLVNHLKLFDIHFSHLLAILSLSFFIHNVIGSILKNQKSLKHTQRDTGIAFLIAGMIYAVPGILGAFAFRFASIDQNFLNQFSSKSIYANISRGAVLFQLMSIYPLLLSVVRVQFFSFVYRNSPNKEKQQYPGLLQVAALNFVVCLITTSMAAFYPMVGTVLRFTGAICGLIYMYMLPVTIHLVVQYKKKQLSIMSVIFHAVLLLFGLSILVLQFIDFDQFTHKGTE